MSLYAASFGVYIIFFMLDLKEWVDRLSILVQLVVWLFGVAVVKTQLGGPTIVFGSKASLLNLIAFFLLFVFLGFMWFVSSYKTSTE